MIAQMIVVNSTKQLYHWLSKIIFNKQGENRVNTYEVETIILLDLGKSWHHFIHGQ